MRGLLAASLSGEVHGSRCHSFLMGRCAGFLDRTCLAEAAIRQKILQAADAAAAGGTVRYIANRVEQRIALA